jgi:hypothetical protein
MRHISRAMVDVPPHGALFYMDMPQCVNADYLFARAAILGLLRRARDDVQRPLRVSPRCMLFH